MKKITTLALALCVALPATQTFAHSINRAKFYQVADCQGLAGRPLTVCQRKVKQQMIAAERDFVTNPPASYVGHKATVNSNSCTGTYCVVSGTYHH